MSGRHRFGGYVSGRARTTIDTTVDAGELVELPPSSSADPVRGFAYDAVRDTPISLWLHLPWSIETGIGILARHLPELSTSGARWTGAGVVSRWSASWFAFSGPDHSCVIIAGNPGPVETNVTRLRALNVGVQRGRRNRVSRNVLASSEALPALPVWEIAGFGHLAPGAPLGTAHAVAAA